MTTSLNPNAEVFHSSQPVTSSAAAIDTPSTHWTDPLAPDLAVTNISTGSNPEYVSCVGNRLLIFFSIVSVTGSYLLHTVNLCICSSPF